MLIGFTYDLRADYLAQGHDELETAEFDSEETIGAIERELRALGHQVERIGSCRQLVEKLARGARWDLVFNIAEGLYGLGREAQVPAVLDAYRIPYTFSDPMVLALTLHKGMTKHVFRGLGLATPDFAVIEDAGAVDGLNLPYPLFAKPVAEGTGKGITAASRLTEPAQAKRVCAELLARFRQPVLVETYLPGREFTVGIVGTGARARVVGVMEVLLLANAEAGAYSFENKENWKGRVEYRLAQDAEGRQAGELALAAWRGLGCRDGGRIDLRSDAAGQPSLMEINPLAGLRPEYSDLPIVCALAGQSYRALIADIVESARERCGR